MRINNLTDVRNSRFLCSLKEQAEKFGLECCYADITELPGFEGVYFFCGTDLHSYLKNDEDIKGVIKRSSLNDCFLLKAKAFRLNGNDDFVAHQHIMIYMHNSELLQRVYKEKGLPLPKKVDNDAVINIRNLYANLVNAKNSWKQVSLETQLIKELKGEVYPHSDSQNETFVYDSGKGRISNFFRKHFNINPTNVSLPHLIATSASVETISIKAEYRKKIIDALNKNSNILYHASKVVGDVIQADENEGFGSKEANDLRHFTLSFNEIYKEEVMDIVNRTLYPELCKQDAQSLNREYGDLIPFSIPTYEWENITNLLNANNIPFAYDINRHDTFDISLVVPQSYEQHLEAVLDRLAKEKEDFKICAFPVISSDHFEPPLSPEVSEAKIFSPNELFTTLNRLMNQNEHNSITDVSLDNKEDIIQ